jgi:hypothetical protein
MELVGLGSILGRTIDPPDFFVAFLSPLQAKAGTLPVLVRDFSFSSRFQPMIHH